MNIAVVFKQDGTVQCETPDPIPLEHHAAELRRMGVTRILGQVNVPGPYPVNALRGLSTGRVNAFAIPRADWDQIASGIVGTLGFRLWTGAPYPKLDLPGDGTCVGGNSSLAGLPVLIRELIGRPGRSYRQGDVLTDDHRPDRVNVEHDEDGRIADVWFG